MMQTPQGLHTDRPQAFSEQDPSIVLWDGVQISITFGKLTFNAALHAFPGALCALRMHYTICLSCPGPPLYTKTTYPQTLRCNYNMPMAFGFMNNFPHQPIEKYPWHHIYGGGTVQYVFRWLGLLKTRWSSRDLGN